MTLNRALLIVCGVIACLAGCLALGACRVPTGDPGPSLLEFFLIRAHCPLPATTPRPSACVSEDELAGTMSNMYLLQANVPF
jgi:hypothetical protein